jgi:hypothetical protein
VDVAWLYDSAGNDVLTTTPDYGQLVGDGFSLYAAGFDYLHGYSQAGGNDTAEMLGSSADDHFYSNGAISYLSGEGYFTRAKFFDTVDVRTGEGTNTAEVYDAVLEQVGTLPGDSAPAFSRLALLYEFDHIDARNDPDSGDRTIDAVDEIFGAYWN